MEIGIFNETNEDLEKELNSLQELLEDFCKREHLNNVIFNIIVVDKDTIHSINNNIFRICI